MPLNLQETQYEKYTEYLAVLKLQGCTLRLFD